MQIAHGGHEGRALVLAQFGAQFGNRVDDFHRQVFTRRVVR
jgi:hypothetical protein